MTDTSRQALGETEEQRGDLRDRVYATLRNRAWVYGGMTKGEVDDVLDNAHAHKRLTELERDGLVHRAGTRRCTVTAREATVWRAGPDPDPVASERARLREEEDRLLSRLAAVRARKRELAPEGQQSLFST